MSDLREAAERLRRIKNSEEPEIVYGMNPGIADMHRADLRTVADQWLSEHDETLIDEAFIRSLGIRKREGFDLCFVFSDDRFEIEYYEGVWLLEFRGDHLCDVTTRGQLRLLLRALNIGKETT